MDPVTHTLTGITAANGWFRNRIGREAVPILAVAANLPDLDGASYLGGGPYALLLRRTFGHSIFLIPLWCALLALATGWIYPRLKFRTRCTLALFGCAMHLLFDLINSFGVVVLWPFSDWRPELAIVFIVDFILTGLLAAPLLFAIPKRMRPHLASLSRAACAAVVLYLALCGLSRQRAVQLLETRVESAPAFAYVFPEPLGPHRWRGVVRDGDLYRLYLIDSLGGRVDRAGDVRTADGDARVEAAKRSPLGVKLDGFFKAPVWTVTEGAGGAATVSVYDLRFRTLVLNRSAIFEYVFRVQAGRAVVVDW
ncbi:MAG: metal-dependent hydrolase [Acidobacteria bacterium]|nr:metal-dependent hydrolase [Acidobacteriota bacterium]